ncbi:Ig-like domain-containing protein [Fretibacter rubidus]|uniref:Ig-like domain-containing protein n=1 Tax=Fretibacter rubidus TaxID=570162 RepID=UPI00352A3622
MANEILGTVRDDVINGTADDDLIKTFEGDDVVIAGSGDDEVYTGLGDDRLEGGAGDDYLVSNEGNDILLGGAGSDRLFGCEDDDILDGGAGQDFVNAGIGNDILIFNAAENSGSRAPDYYSGLDGIDTLVLELTQAEFAAAQSDIDGFLSYIRQITGANGESTGAFFRFQTINLAVQEVENLQIVVAGEVVFTTAPSADDDSFNTGEAGVIDGTVADNDDVNPGSTFTIVQNVANGTLVLNADGSFTFDTNGAFDGLGDGETATETFTYRVSSPNADDVTATATITITGQNDAPVVSTITAQESEDAPSFVVDLLAGATDADTNDSLSVTNVRLDDGTGSVTVPSNNVGLAEGSVVSAANVVNDGKLSIDLSNYQYLAVGETLTLTVSYDVFDGTTTTPNTATLTIIGENDIPTVASAITATIDETAPPITIDMLAGASDIDSTDVLSVSNFTVVSGNAAGLVQNGSSLSIDGSAYANLNDGETETVVISYQVTDGNGGSVTQTATITVNGEGTPPPTNSDPIVAAPIVITLRETDGLTAIDLLAGASDPDGDTLTAATPNLISGDGIGSFVGAGSLSVDGTAYAAALDAGDVEQLLYLVEISDGNGGSIVQSVTVNIIGAGGSTPTNQPPFIDSGLDVFAFEDDSPLSVFLTDNVTDPDGDTLSIVNLTGLAAGLTYDTSTFELSIDPSDGIFQSLAVGDSATYTLNYDIIDGNGGSVSRTTFVEIEGVNDDPIVAAPLSFTISETDSLTFFDLLIGASDVDNGTTLSAGDVFIQSGDDVGAITSLGTLGVDGTAYAAALDAGETEVLVYEFDITDGDGGSVTQTVTVTIEGAGGGANNPPEDLDPVVFSSTEDNGTFSVNMLTGTFDPDGDTLSAVNVTGLIAGVTFDSVNSRLDIDTGDLGFQALAAGEVFDTTFDYQVIDGNGGSVDRTFFFTLTGVNDDPVVAAPLSFTISETDSLTFFDLLIGASDIDNGDTISAGDVFIQSGNDVGAITSLGTLGVDGTAYAALLDAGETEVLVYQFDITDNNGGSVTQTVTVTIEGAGGSNNPPDPFDFIDFITNEDASPTSVNLLSGASDPDGDTLTATNVTGLVTGITFDAATSSLIVDPSSYQGLGMGDTVMFTINYDVIDGNGGTVSNFAEITIEGINDDPVAGTPLDLTFTETDAAGVVDLTVGVTDVDSATFNVNAFTVTSGDGGGLSINGAGDFIVDPTFYTSLNDGESEVITIAYDIIDNDGGSVSTTATFTVTGVSAANTPPVSNEFAVIFVDEGGTSFAGAAQGASDPDGDKLTAINLPTLPSWLTFDAVNQRFNADGTDPIFDSLRVGQFLDFDFTYDLSDGNGGTVGHGLGVVVEGTNDAPVVAAPLTRITQEDFSVDFLDLLQGASDVDDGDFLSIRNVTGLNSAFTVNYEFGEIFIETGDDALDFIRANQTFDFVISYEIHDLFGGFTTQTATITVEGFNDNPEVEGALSATVFDEGTGGPRVFNLLQGAIDPEGTALTVSNIVLPSFLPTGVFTFDATAGTLTVDTTGYNVASVDEDYSFSYDITDADGGVTTQQIGITIQFQQLVPTQPPTTSPITLVFTEDTVPASIDLLQGANDPDGDTLTVTNIGALPAGVFFSSFDNSIFVVNNIVQGLNAGETLNINTSYTIEDGNGGFVDNTLSVTINGLNDAPNNFAPVTRTFTEDAGFVRIDLLSNSNDPDRGDVLSVDGFPATGGLQDTRFDGERYLAIDLDSFAYQSLSAGETADYNISYNVADENGGVTAQTGVITITGVNDVATVFDDDGFLVQDNDAIFTDDLSFLVNEIDTNDAYALTSVSLASGSTSAAFTFSGGQFTFDPSQFGLITSGLVILVEFDFTFTSGPDTVTGTFSIVIEPSGPPAPPQEPIDPTIMVYVSDPDKPIVKTGPDGVYADSLDSDWFASDTDDGFDFAPVPDMDMPVSPTLDDNLLTDDISAANSDLTKAHALAGSDGGDPPVIEHIFDGLSIFAIEVDLGAL